MCTICKGRDKFAALMVVLYEKVTHTVYVHLQLRVEKEERAQLQNQVEEKAQRIQELLETLNASRESEVELEETFRQELAAQKKLTEVYQGV